MADNVVVNASERSRLVKALFESIEQSSSLLSSDELKIAMESLRVATLETKQREELEQRRKAAEQEAKLRAEDEARRQKALRRAAKREEAKH